MIEGHGDDIYRYKNMITDNFSSNIYMGVDHSALIRYINAHFPDISSYPDPYGTHLASGIARIKGINHSNVILTNGCTECIYLIARLFRGKKATILSPTFSEYKDACMIHDMDTTLAMALQDIKDETDVAWICNPNNPTGTVIPKEMLLAAVHSHRKTTFVIDQAYEEYTSAPLLSCQEAIEAGNVILLNSLTKNYSVPGLRIGYAVATEPLIESLHAVHMPWAVNSIALIAGEYLIGHCDEYVIPKEFLHAEALHIAEEFTRLGIEVSPTDCNFILCCLPERSASELKEYLATRHGILIRDASNFDGLTSRHFRVAAQSSAQNECLIKAVEQWMCV